MRRNLLIKISNAPYKKEIEYIENQHEAYIDTGIQTSSEVDIELKVSDLDGNSWLFGTIDNGDWQQSYGMYCGRTEYDGCCRFNYRDWGTNMMRYKPNFIMKVSHTDSQRIVMLDNEKSIIPQTQFRLNGPLFLFTANWNETTPVPMSAPWTAICKMHYCKIWDNGELVRDFVPVLDNKNIPCFFDKISQTCFYSPNGEQFVYKSEKA